MHEMFAGLGLPENPGPMRPNSLYAVVPLAAAMVADLGADAMVMADRLALDALRRVADRLDVTVDVTTIRRHSAMAVATDEHENRIYLRHSIHGEPLFLKPAPGTQPDQFEVYWNAEVL